MSNTIVAQSQSTPARASSTMAAAGRNEMPHDRRIDQHVQGLRSERDERWEREPEDISVVESMNRLPPCPSWKSKPSIHALSLGRNMRE
jgi:hypothetical protein